MAEMEDINLRFYNEVRSAPEEALKKFNNGNFSGDDINPMWRIKMLTKQFGVAGFGWYTEVTRMDTLEVGDDVITIVNINLYVKIGTEWSKPIFGTGGNRMKSAFKSGAKVSDEGFKMAYTDAISVACKALGIGADVYFRKDVSSKYAAFYDENETATQTTEKRTEKPLRALADKVAAHSSQNNSGAPKPSGKRMATDEQRAIILGLPDGDPNRAQAVQFFGENLETLTAAQANSILKRIQEV